MPLDDRNDRQRELDRKHQASDQGAKPNAFMQYLKEARRRQNENPVRDGFLWVALLALAAYSLFDLIRSL